jgi:hypothetical protein
MTELALSRDVLLDRSGSRTRAEAIEIVERG